MPIDYSKYPPNWLSEIRPRIMARAGNRCEHCGVEHHAIIKRMSKTAYRPPTDEEWESISARASKNSLTKSLKWFGFTRIVLTIAHLDHDSENWDVQDDRLAALCQSCHFRYDLWRNTAKRRFGMDIFNQPTLF
jgi:hypothetical protein